MAKVRNKETLARGSSPSQVVSLDVVQRFVNAASDALSAAREDIDVLNVFPIADGDTGTNMFLTFSAGRDALADYRSQHVAPQLAPAINAFAEAALLGARGNSGVILSQMLASFLATLGSPQADERPSNLLSRALSAAAVDAYGVLSEPVEGTMLTVLTKAADAARLAAQHPRTSVIGVFRAASQAARKALEHTPEQLPILAAAGVVDAGGVGVCVLLDAAESVLAGGRSSLSSLRRSLTPGLGSGSPTYSASPPVGYEVMYVAGMTPDALSSLRKALAEIGDSIAIARCVDGFRVHVHADNPGLAIEVGLKFGALSHIQIAQMTQPHPQANNRGIVAVAAGGGLAHLFRQAGAVVVDLDLGHRPSTAQFMAAMTASHASEVIVLPNDADSLRSAEIAARTVEADFGIKVVVIPTNTQVAGLAALAVHLPSRSLTENYAEMAATARHVRHGAVTQATRSAMTMAGPCAPGDVLGIVGGDFALIGVTLEKVASEVLDRLVAAGGELVTVVFGEGRGGTKLADHCVAYLADNHPHLEVVVYDGGQPRYPLLFGVE
jgi:uncharacterized protein